jgi:Tfp pilus assembly protein PilX
VRRIPDGFRLPNPPLLPRCHSRRSAERTAETRSGEAGYALIELMVVASLLIIVLSAILALGETTQRIAPKEKERAHVIREAQVGLHRMTRELRHAYEAPTVTGSTMLANVRGVGGSTATVRYDCDEAHPTDPAYTRCVRQVFTGGAWSAADPVIDRVLNGTAVFAFTSPDYVSATVEVAARGDLDDGYDYRVVLADGFYMRNLDG